MSEQDELLQELIEAQADKYPSTVRENNLTRAREWARQNSWTIEFILAKAKQHYEQKKCQFEKDGVCYALACYSDKKCGARDNEGNPIYAEQKRLDRPDREKIGDILECFGTQMKEICDEQPYLMMLIARSCKARNEALTKILALIPDIEETKKQERERVLGKIRKNPFQYFKPTWDKYHVEYDGGIEIREKEWQTLKGEK